MCSGPPGLAVGWKGRETRNRSTRRLERILRDAFHEISYRSANFFHVLNVKHDARQRMELGLDVWFEQDKAQGWQVSV